MGQLLVCLAYFCLAYFASLFFDGARVGHFHVRPGKKMFVVRARTWEGNMDPGLDEKA
jgi:hypothetical protein